MNVCKSHDYRIGTSANAMSLPLHLNYVGTPTFLPAMLDMLAASADAPPIDPIPEDANLVARLVAWTLSRVFNLTTHRLKVRTPKYANSAGTASDWDTASGFVSADNHNNNYPSPTSFLRSLFLSAGSSVSQSSAEASHDEPDTGSRSSSASLAQLALTGINNANAITATVSPIAHHPHHPVPPTRQKSGRSSSPWRGVSSRSARPSTSTSGGTIASGPTATSSDPLINRTSPHQSASSPPPVPHSHTRPDGYRHSNSHSSHAHTHAQGHVRSASVPRPNFRPLSSTSTHEQPHTHVHHPPHPPPPPPIMSIPNALVITGLENASIPSQRALVRVLADRRLVLPKHGTGWEEYDGHVPDRRYDVDEEDEDDVINLPDEFVIVYITSWTPTERPNIHKSLLDRFSMSTNITISPRTKLSARSFSPALHATSCPIHPERQTHISTGANPFASRQSPRLQHRSLSSSPHNHPFSLPVLASPARGTSPSDNNSSSTFTAHSPCTCICPAPMNDQTTPVQKSKALPGTALSSPFSSGLSSDSGQNRRTSSTTSMVVPLLPPPESHLLRSASARSATPPVHTSHKTQSQPQLSQPQPIRPHRHPHSHPLSNTPPPSSTLHPLLSPILSPTLIPSLRRLARERTYLSPELVLYMQDLLTAVRHDSPGVDGMLVGARAVEDAAVLVKAWRVVGSELRGWELVRGGGMIEKGKKVRKMEDSDEEEELESGYREGEGSIMIDVGIDVLEGEVGALGGHGDAYMRESMEGREGVERGNEMEIGMFDVSEADIARVVPRVVSHRVRMRDGWVDEVLASAVVGAAMVRLGDGVVHVREGEKKGNGDRDTVKDVLVRVLQRV
ncbi:hypothetical protein AMATHDRAFT_64021 [Amanita thiersii Skay4041]|uniref:Uncharacterized protein n=1 Tax=Amanita thiersii Skay4041 TaxID=703135 RepID=A0A2A9NMP9_9AGAR|nr:hypothetical protein AMATHDRAFT_64021 [Amanita thiersii Skay4041]